MSSANPRRDTRAVAISPGRLHERAARRAVARLGDRALLTLLAGGVFAGYQAEVGHEVTRRAKATEIAQLGHDSHRVQCLDAAKVPTFVALLGNHLKVTVLLDSRKEGHQRLGRMARDGYLDKQRIIVVGDVLGRTHGDIEDLFGVGEYLSLYNKAFGKRLKEDDLKGSDSVVARIARHEKVDRFDHGRPADVLLREREAVLSKLSDDTLKRFEALFERVNKTLGT